MIGLGAIGLQTARIARGIGMNVIAWTMHPDGKPLDEIGIRPVELDKLYRESDVVSLHLRQSSDTTGFIGKREFELMKPSAIFINTARGPIVDEAALIDVLRSKSIRGAGLDVYDTEPLPENHPLSALPNVVMTPHSGGVTPEGARSRAAIGGRQRLSRPSPATRRIGLLEVRGKWAVKSKTVAQAGVFCRSCSSLSVSRAPPRRKPSGRRTARW